MNEIEEITKAIEGVKAKIQIQKAENQKLRNTLNKGIIKCNINILDINIRINFTFFI